MVIDTEHARRIGIFFFYDKDGIADSYVKILLDEMNKWLTDLYIVVNGVIEEKSFRMFQSISSKVIVRENEGFDVWAYKTAIEDIGWDGLSTYDEMIMFNFTIYGPFFPFEEMFQSMDKKDVDFWGITKHYEIEKDSFWGEEGKMIPTHLQSHFIAVRNRMICDKSYQKYWDEHVFIHNYKEAVLCHEAIFTKQFAERGFTWVAYIETDDMKEYTCYPLMEFPQQLLKRRCPILKRKGFFWDYMNYIQAGTYGEAVDKAIDYVRDNTDYNTDYIWENILRTSSMNDIRNCFHLDKIVEESKEQSELFYNKAILFLVITETASKDTVLENIKKVDKLVQIVILSNLSQEDTKTYIEGTDIPYELINISERKSVIATILKYVEEKAYEIAGFLTDRDYKYDPEKTWHGLECIISSEGYVKGVQKTFADEKRLGMLATPRMYHGTHVGKFGKEWEVDSDRRTELLNRYKISVPVPEEGMIVYAADDMAWYRVRDFVDVLKSVKEDSNLSEKEIRWLIPLILQQCGLYSAYGMPIQVAARNMNNYQFFFRQYQSVVNTTFEIEDFGTSLWYVKEGISKLSNHYDEMEKLRKYAGELEEQCGQLEKDVAESGSYARGLEERCSHLEKDIVESGNYMRSLEKEIQEMKKVIADAAEYSRTLENEIAVYKEREL